MRYPLFSPAPGMNGNTVGRIAEINVILIFQARSDAVANTARRVPESFFIPGVVAPVALHHAEVKWIETKDPIQIGMRVAEQRGAEARVIREIRYGA